MFTNKEIATLMNLLAIDERRHLEFANKAKALTEIEKEELQIYYEEATLWYKLKEMIKES